jgi:kynurenine formamidase
VLDLLDVEPGEYGLIALPIKLVGVEGAPARVVLVRPEDAVTVLR